MEQTPGAGSSDQGGDDRFMNRFALRGINGPFDGAEAMRTALAHQNPLHTVVLPRNQAGALRAPSAGLLTTDSPDVVVTAFKPAEDDGAGFVVRLWELGGTEAAVHLDASALHPARAWRTSLIETDLTPATMVNGVVSGLVEPNEIATFRFATVNETSPVRRPGSRVTPR